MPLTLHDHYYNSISSMLVLILIMDIQMYLLQKLQSALGNSTQTQLTLTNLCKYITSNNFPPVCKPIQILIKFIYEETKIYCINFKILTLAIKIELHLNSNRFLFRIKSPKPVSAMTYLPTLHKLINFHIFLQIQ